MHRRLLPLPVEILDEIVSHSGDDQQILRSLRASSYALSSYATPKVFRRLFIRQGMDDSTCASIRALLLSNSPVLAHVKEVEFIVGGFDDYSEEEITIFHGAVMDIPWGHYYDLEGLWPLIGRIVTIQSVFIDLRSIGVDRDWGGYMQLGSQNVFLMGVAHFPTGQIKSLEIYNFVAYPLSIFNWLTSSLIGLENFRLRNFYGDLEEGCLWFGDMFAQKFFSSVAPTLTSLTIQPSYELIDNTFWECFFPRLETLSVTSGLTMVEEPRKIIRTWDAFLLKHKVTLRSLTLVNCFAFAKEGTVKPRVTIGSIWRMLRRELLMLVALDILYDRHKTPAVQFPYSMPKDHQSYYIDLDCSLSKLRLLDIEEDGVELEAWVGDVVKRRRMAARAILHRVA